MKRKKTGELDMDVTRGTVLIVDSDESVRSSISRELQAKGLECVTAGGQEAVETASTQDFDLLIMGPGRSGPSEIEVIAQIVADHPETVVVMADTGAESQVTAKTTKRSKHTYVADPEGIDLDALASRVEKALEKKRPTSKNGNGGIPEPVDILHRQAHDLRERVKELSCLYGISSLASRQDASLDDILAGTVNLIPPSWQYPDVTCARIVNNNQEFCSGNFVETQWKQSREIIVHGELVGAVEVCYREQKPGLDEGPFLKEERKLIDAIAERLGRIIERKQTEGELAESRNRLEELVDERTGELRTANEQLQNTTDELRGVNDRLLSEIVEREQADQRLRELYEEERGLRQQLEVEFNKRVEFTRTLAHELKTPLTSVLTCSEMLLANPTVDRSIVLARSVNRSAMNLNERIEELLDLARGEIGMLKLRLEPLDLLQLLRDIGNEMGPIASSEEQTLILDLPSSLPLIKADGQRVEQIVANLLSNAFKFTPEGGRITLRAAEKEAAVVIEVKDTGPGISRSEQERIFDPYHRLDDDRARLSGLGLGLALSKTLAELHGGHISVRSRPGHGSTFTLALPLEGAKARIESAEQPNATWKVLLIEDDKDIIGSVSLVLDTLWPEAQLVSSRRGEKGVGLVETEKPDVVLLDLGLPDMTGFEVLRQIRLFTHVPVIILSVKTEEEDIVKALERGADDYLTKPFRQKELVSRLQVQVRKQLPISEEAIQVCGPLRLDPSTSQVVCHGRETNLTTIESQILQCLIGYAGHVVSHSRISEIVWGEDYPGTSESLRVHIRRLREKLEEDPGNPQLILTRPGIGYLLARPG
ncbi:MAG: response regulator [Dehalococcoidia bacterium]